MSDRNGIEIDYCPECRGVWLDRGELDKIIERSSQNNQNNQNTQQFSNREQQNYSKSYSDNHKKKKGFLGDIFDF